MAARLIDELSRDWDPEAWRDDFKDRIMALVKRKAEAGDAEWVEPIEPGELPAKGANVVDLTELLKRSLRPAAGAKGGTKASARRKRA